MKRLTLLLLTIALLAASCSGTPPTAPTGYTVQSSNVRDRPSVPVQEQENTKTEPSPSPRSCGTTDYINGDLGFEMSYFTFWGGPSAVNSTAIVFGTLGDVQLSKQSNIYLSISKTSYPISGSGNIINADDLADSHMSAPGFQKQTISLGGRSAIKVSFSSGTSTLSTIVYATSPDGKSFVIGYDQQQNRIDNSCSPDSLLSTLTFTK